MTIAAPAALGIVGGTGAFGAFTTYNAAQRQNDAIGRSLTSANRGATTQLNQLATQAAQQRAERIARTQQIIGKLRVANAESGAGFGGSFSALEQQALVDSGKDQGIVESNYGANAGRVLSGLEATNLQLESEYKNPWMTALLGGLQGVSTGLSIVSGVKSIAELANTPMPTQPADPVREPFIVPDPAVATTGIGGLPQLPDIARTRDLTRIA